MTTPLVVTSQTMSNSYTNFKLLSIALPGMRTLNMLFLIVARCYNQRKNLAAMPQGKVFHKFSCREQPHPAYPSAPCEVLRETSIT